ncbi:alpha/beta hydrolase [Sphingomonas bacterium]|uniref:alpha/beta hydrolase n=1 Tax=Sphingomonas bacterium TaxID=1895847 RepID=UPI001575E47B|nr:alpha/beta hydrolase [Sphingomonas bacterium]
MSVPYFRRYAKGSDFISFGDDTPAAKREDVVLTAFDGAKSKAALYSNGNEKTVICLMHPRADMTRHYSVPGFTRAGYAFFSQLGRSPGPDAVAQTIHEWLLTDIAAGMAFLRSRGFEKLVLLGNSGAATLFSLYHKQATTPPPGRLTDTAAGDPYDLNKVDMPVADGFVFLGAHLGPGVTLQTEMDPSVVDENDPASCDPFLDMFDERNGFREPPAETTYAEDFLARFRAAQVVREGRIDAIAWKMVEDQRDAEQALAADGVDHLPYGERATLYRRASVTHLMHVHRLQSDPKAVDFSITPSDRSYGTLMSIRPDLSNYDMEMGTKVVEPRVWLSSWSARYSRANLLRQIDAVTMPSLVLSYSGDNALSPDVAEKIFAQSPAQDKEMTIVVGDHFGYRVPHKPDEGGRDVAIKAMVDWLKPRFPAV